MIFSDAREGVFMHDSCISVRSEGYVVYEVMSLMPIVLLGHRS